MRLKLQNKPVEIRKWCLIITRKKTFVLNCAASRVRIAFSCWALLRSLASIHPVIVALADKHVLNPTRLLRNISYDSLYSKESKTTYRYFNVRFLLFKIHFAGTYSVVIFIGLYCCCLYCYRSRRYTSLSVKPCIVRLRDRSRLG